MHNYLSMYVHMNIEIGVLTHVSMYILSIKILATQIYLSRDNVQRMTYVISFQFMTIIKPTITTMTLMILMTKLIYEIGLSS